MKKILKNSNGNAVSTGGKLLGSPEGENPLQKLINNRTLSGYYLFYTYKESKIDFINDLDFSNNVSCSNMFDGASLLTEIPLFNTSAVISMNRMFNYCSSLQTIPLFDTSKVTTMNYMFNECHSLQTIPLLDTRNVTDMKFAFNNCNLLKTIDITSLDKISSTSNMHSFASNCNSLTKLIIRTMTTIPPINTNSFTNCYHFTGTVNSTYNPEGLKDGRIYVPDNMVEELKVATNWSVYADIIVPLSTLVED